MLLIVKTLLCYTGLSPRIENIPSDSKIALLVFECEGTESGLIMCPMSLYFNTVCYYALVQCNTPNTSSYISGLEKSSSLSLPSLPIAIETSSILEYQTKLITSDIKSEYHIMSSSSISLHLPPSIDGNQQETSNDSTRAGKVIAGVAVSLLVVIVIVVGIVLLCVIIIYRKQKKQTMYNVKENNNG